MHPYSLLELNQLAHPNSILARKYPNGARPEDLPNFGLDRTDTNALANTGFPDDWPTREDDHFWDDPLAA